ncbi:MAG TPA: diguanylate cyclase [Fimbriimonadaceae bacterium]|nr:diguanylate cyclase [Fimbriimonadaceae bacterium]
MFGRTFRLLSQLPAGKAAALASAKVLLTVLAVCALLYVASMKAIKYEVESNLQRLAEVTAATIDGDLHQTFTDPKQETSEAYNRAIEPMRTAQEAGHETAYIYTLVLRDGKAHFILDPTEAGDEDGDGVDDKSHIMQEYPEVSEDALRALQEGIPIAESEPYTDSWGTFISGYAPIFDSKGKQVGIVGVDLDAKDYVAHLQGVKNAGIIAIVLGCLLSLFSGVLIYFGQRTALAHKAQLIENQEALEEAKAEADKQNVALLDQQNRLEDAVKRAKLANEQMQVASARFGRLFHGLPVACFTFDSEGRIHEFNDLFQSLLGIPIEQILTQTVSDLFGETSRFTEVFSAKEVEDVEWTFTKSDGSTLILASSAFLMGGDERLTGAIGSLVDITERKQLQDQLNKQLEELEEKNRLLDTLSTTDGLTGVKNRRALEQSLHSRLSLAQREGRPLSILLLDVDKFKQLNDNFGHQVGDQVLQQVAQILKDTARDADVVARYGGEEFVVILSNTNVEQSGIAAERYRSAIEKGKWEHRPVTASFGISTYVAGSFNHEDLIRQADEALYHAKENGRNRCAHFVELSDEGLAA